MVGDFHSSKSLLIIMQGRLKSTRLPAKGFLSFFDQIIYERMCDIANNIQHVGHVVFATGDDPDNEIIRPHVEKKGVSFFMGPEDNVLERFVMVLGQFCYDYICRITCDNYLIQPILIDALFEKVLEDRSQYGYIEPLSHYSGEIISSSVLLDHYKTSYSDIAKEHVTWDIRKNPNIKKTILPHDYMGLDHTKGVTLDTLDDFICMKSLEHTNKGLRKIQCMEEIKKLIMEGSIS